MIAGYSNKGLSTDISGANWIASQSPMDESGDDFGAKIGNNLLVNNANTSASGIAVFNGTTVTADSIPEDAVFYGKKVGGALQKNKGYGLLIPTRSDLYSAVNPTTGADQPLFGEGTNTFLVPKVFKFANGGYWAAMGGVVSSNGNYWIKTRENPTILLLHHNSELSEIESGSAVTKIKQSME